MALTAAARYATNGRPSSTGACVGDSCPYLGGVQTFRFMVPSTNVTLDVQLASFSGARWRLQSVLLAQTRKQ